MKLEDIRFEVTKQGKFSVQKNSDSLFSYLSQKVDEEGAINLSDIAGELAKRFEAYKNTVGTNLNNTAEVVCQSQQYGLKIR